MKKQVLWLSSYRMTVRVVTGTSGMIVSTAPIIRRFINQPISNLFTWMRKQGGLLIKVLSEDECAK